MNVKEWIETRSGETFGPFKMLRGYKVGDAKFDREHYASYAECRAAAETYAEGAGHD